MICCQATELGHYSSPFTPPPLKQQSTTENKQLKTNITALKEKCTHVQTGCNTPFLFLKLACDVTAPSLRWETTAHATTFWTQVLISYRHFFQLLKLHAAEWEYDEWMINWRGCGRTKSWFNLRYCPSIYCEELGDSRKPTVSTSSENGTGSSTTAASWNACMFKRHPRLCPRSNPDWERQVIKALSELTPPLERRTTRSEH
jgi:hypothetical protein